LSCLTGKERHFKDSTGLTGIVNAGGWIGAEVKTSPCRTSLRGWPLEKKKRGGDSCKALKIGHWGGEKWADEKKKERSTRRRDFRHGKQMKTTTHIKTSAI